jgi:transposase
MRGDEGKQSAMFSYVAMSQRIPAAHPVRQIRAMVDRALEGMDAELEQLYSHTGHTSIAPERLLRASLLMALYSIRSERQLMEQLNYNLLFRLLVGLEMDDPVWDVTVFTKNRERLIAGQASKQLLSAVLLEAEDHELLSEEHFTVDGTLIQAWASACSFKEKSDPAPGAGSGHKGEVLLRDKVESSTDPDERRSISQQKRKLIERVFGWNKLTGLLRQVKLRGLKRVDWFYRMAVVAYNLMRMRKLIPIQSPAS